MNRSATLALLAFLCIGSFGQSGRQLRDSLRLRVVLLRNELGRIDSTGDAARSIDARIELAGLLKGKDALQVLQEAAALADSAHDPWRGSVVRTSLMERYRATGDHKRAVAEAVRIIALGHDGRARELKDVAEEIDLLTTRRDHERDSLIAVHEKEADSARARIEEVLKGIAMREKVIVAAGTIALLLAAGIILILFRQRKARSRLAAEVKALQSRVAELSKAIEGMVLQAEKQVAPVPPPSPTMAPPSITGTAPAPSPTLDPMVLAFFRRQAPERIATLQAARASGDHEKVLRVLHSLRPQLDALDPQGLGVLCARLRGMQPGHPERGAGLDQLITGINTLLSSQ